MCVVLFDFCIVAALAKKKERKKEEKDSMGGKEGECVRIQHR
jgi:hypothetical protein